MKYFILAIFLQLTFGAAAQQSTYSSNSGHSHNDYNQPKPFYAAYGANMGSIEADVFLKDGQLLVAHNESDTDPKRNLTLLYLKPIAKAFRQNKGFIYADTTLSLQLVVDIKANHTAVLAAMILALKPYFKYFDERINSHAVRIVISGDMPAPENFKDYPSYLYFDGRTTNTYTPEQQKRLGMVSENIGAFTRWNGFGAPTAEDKQKLAAVIAIAHGWHKPFRFWGTADVANSWSVLQDLGADWIGTDHPEQLKAYFK